MKKFAGILFCVAALYVTPMKAQSAPLSLPNAPAPASSSASKPPIAEDYNPCIPAKFEISAGYVYRKYSPTATTSFPMNGGYVSVDYNIFSWLGAAAELHAADAVPALVVDARQARQQHGGRQVRKQGERHAEPRQGADLRDVARRAVGVGRVQDLGGGNPFVPLPRRMALQSR